MTPADEPVDLPPDVPVDVLVDLGRSHVRVVCGQVDERIAGGAGLHDPGGPDAAAALVSAAIAQSVSGRIDRIAVCAPGVSTSRELAARFAAALGAGSPVTPSEVLVVSDSAAWQYGAFRGGDGAVLALGTGAVTVARTGDVVRRLDGLGLLLGDVGGGAWIGLAALRSAAREDGPLRVAAVARFGPVDGWAALQSARDLAGTLASFVPDVVALDRSGVPAAADVLDAAADGLHDTLEALPAGLPVCVVGGLATVLGPRLRQLPLPRRHQVPLPWVEPAGDAVDGLRLLLEDTGPYTAESIRLRVPSRPGQPAAAGHDTDALPTEAVAPDTDALDTWPTDRLVARLATGHEPAVRAVLGAVGPLARAAELAGAALRGRGRLVYVGAGTPGRLALQDAAELTPTFALDPSRTVVLLAGGDAAGERAVEGAEDDDAAAVRAVDAAQIGPDDVVVGISASGRTPFVLAALARARDRGAVTVGMSSVAGAPLSRAADIGVELPTGPEVIAGSTRLCAGTAQKIALNTLSTAALVRAGATYGPWMVDVLATNDKLRRRCVRIVRDAAGVSERTADDTLRAAGGSVRAALVVLLTATAPDDAAAAVARTTSVREALGSLRLPAAPAAVDAAAPQPVAPCERQ